MNELTDQAKDIIAADDVVIGKLGPFLTLDVKGPVFGWTEGEELALDVHYRMAFSRKGALYLIAALAESLNLIEEMDDDS